jgi:predicted ribonuclease YlaK
MSKKANLRAQRRNEYENILINKFSLANVKPATSNQRKVFDIYENNEIVGIFGSAGTGKTYLGAYLALRDAFVNDNYSTIIYVRSAVQTRDQGFMPGDEKEKMSYYEQPIIDVVNDLLGDNEAYSVLKRAKKIEFMSTSFCRGLTKENSIIIFDECQSANFHELSTVITRLGKNSKIVLCGDVRQDDLKFNARNRNDLSGLQKLIGVSELMPSFGTVFMTPDDIMRSELVKQFIIAEEKYESLNSNSSGVQYLKS